MRSVTVKLLGLRNDMNQTVFAFYDRCGNEINKLIHNNSPQVYSYEHTFDDEGEPITIRHYISGAFHNGKFSDTEKELIKNEIKAACPAVTVENIMNIIDSFWK